MSITRPSPRPLLTAALGALAMGLMVPAFAAKKEVTDIEGRKVTITSPAKRVLLGFYYEDYMAIGTEKAFDRVVGLSREGWEGWRPASWALFTAHRPSLKKLPDVGDVETQSFSVDKVLALRPDVIVLARWQYRSLGADADRLQQAGIPIVVVDYNEETVASHVASTLLIGEVTGQQKRARKIADEYRSAIEAVQARIEQAGLPKPKIYAEFGNKGPSEYSFAYGRSQWGALIDLAGGDNIAAPYVQYWGPMNPEQIIAAKPEVILITGTESSKVPTAMRMGIDVSREDALKRLESFAQRPGWSSLPAVRSKRIHGAYQGASRSVADYASVQYIAKAAYPSLFQDIDPQASYLGFYKRWLPVVPRGTFYVEPETGH